MPASVTRQLRVSSRQLATILIKALDQSAQHSHLTEVRRTHTLVRSSVRAASNHRIPVDPLEVSPLLANQCIADCGRRDVRRQRGYLRYVEQVFRYGGH